MTSRRCLSIFMLIAAILAGGCTIIRSEPTEDVSYANLEYGDGTHYREILRDFGPPVHISALGDGMVWLYEDVILEENQLGFGFSEGILSLFKLSLAAGDGQYDGWVLIFDEDGYLMSAVSLDDAMSLGRGAGFQFILTVSSMVNLSDVCGSSVQEQWGQGLLTDLPRGLNREQDLNLGAHGLQLLTTPPHTGQHTLTNP